MAAEAKGRDNGILSGRNSNATEAEAKAKEEVIVREGESVYSTTTVTADSDERRKEVGVLCADKERWLTSRINHRLRVHIQSEEGKGADRGGSLGCGGNVYGIIN